LSPLLGLKRRQRRRAIAAVCTPILVNATVASIDKVENSQFFRHYLTLICSKPSLSPEQFSTGQARREPEQASEQRLVQEFVAQSAFEKKAF
jgi:hypothetical protein